VDALSLQLSLGSFLFAHFDNRQAPRSREPKTTRSVLRLRRWFQPQRRGWQWSPETEARRDVTEASLLRRSMNEGVSHH
jgi:hypothetical protein